METKQIEVSCPCCSTRLAIDVRTSSVLRATQPQDVDETGKTVIDESRWDEAAGRVSSRVETGKSEFDLALDKERSRERDLDQLFEKAQEKARRAKKEEHDD